MRKNVTAMILTSILLLGQASAQAAPGASGAGQKVAQMLLLGQAQQAEEAARSRLAQKPGDGEARSLLARALAEQGKMALARSELAKAIAIDPKWGDYPVADPGSIMRLEESDPKRALSLLRQIDLINPGQQRVRSRIAALEQRLGLPSGLEPLPASSAKTAKTPEQPATSVPATNQQPQNGRELEGISFNQTAPREPADLSWLWWGIAGIGGLSAGAWGTAALLKRRRRQRELEGWRPRIGEWYAREIDANEAMRLDAKLLQISSASIGESALRGLEAADEQAAKLKASLLEEPSEKAVERASKEMEASRRRIKMDMAPRPSTPVSPTPQQRMLAPKSHPTNQSVGYGEYKPNNEILSTTDHHSPDDSSHQLPEDSVVDKQGSAPKAPAREQTISRPQPEVKRRARPQREDENVQQASASNVVIINNHEAPRRQEDVRLTSADSWDDRPRRSEPEPVTLTSADRWSDPPSSTESSSNDVSTGSSDSWSDSSS